VVCITWWWC